ncbi:phospho-sugar mutase [Dialister sp.]|jgi:phosphoglucomutase|uniref:phospho-sugar mutase n=1 Tax=Dialister sp. TaxID=1955814 RepID=UPI002E821CA8|nr:phospho-sugar mutase [Dialister sp.]MEE3451925.1 phospho-sugar mutase [Dialister sp.]
MDYLEKYHDWLNWADESTKKELSAISDDKEIEDRFYKDLEFGTAGLRGIMGAGTNRMNRYTVAKASRGLADYLKALYPAELKRGVVIAYDSRLHSAEFAREAANVLTASGIPVKLFNELEPIPVLSFSIKHFHALGGIVITASHNPAEYNGYKVYGEDGGQLVPDKANVLTDYVERITDLPSIDDRGNDKLLTLLGHLTVQNFIDAIFKESYYKGNPPALSIVYTPLHGSGNKPVRYILTQAGFTDVHIVEKQEKPDGTFPTVISPNPENEEALALGIRLAGKVNADIVIGTDPDSDRIGAAVKHKEGYTLITGNQMGALLTYFVLSTRKDRLTPASTLVKTVVTGELGADIARSFRIQVVETLTGFKYIGEKISRWAADHTHEFVLGYEESYGYLVGTHAQDKDAVVSAMLICEMAAYFKEKGKTLEDVLAELYKRFGYYYDKSVSYTLKGKTGQEKIQVIMESLRKLDASKLIPDIEETIDFEKGIGDLPKENVMKYRLHSGGWMAIRPSGTEPKIKFYYSLKGNNEEETLKLFNTYKSVWEKEFSL